MDFFNGDSDVDGATAPQNTLAFGEVGGLLARRSLNRTT